MKSNDSDVSQLKWSEEVELETSEDELEELSDRRRKARKSAEEDTKEEKSPKRVDGKKTTSDDAPKAKKEKLTAGKIAKTAAEYFLALLVCLLLFGFTIVLIAKSTLSVNYTISRLPKTYTYRLFNEIDTSVRDYTLPTGLDPSVLDGAVTQEQLDIDFNSCVRNPYPASGFSLDTSGIEEKLNHNVINYLEDKVRKEAEETQDVDAPLAKVPVNGTGEEETEEEYSIGVLNEDGTVTLHEDTLKAVDEYVHEIGDLYRKNVRLPGLDYLAGIGNEFDSKFIFFLIAPILAAVICGFLMIRLQMDAKKSLRYFSFATGGVAMMNVIGPVFVLIQGFYRRLGITPDYFNEFMVSYINGILLQFLVTAGVWLVITVCLALAAVGIERKSGR